MNMNTAVDETKKSTFSWFFYLYNCGNIAFSVASLLAAVIISSNLIMAEEQKEFKAVLQGNGEFTKNLYTVLSRSPGNVFFSPISIHAILSLTYQGASGQTQKAFSKALNIADKKIAALGYKDVMTRLNTVKDVTLHIANKIFLQETYELQDSFKSVSEDQFLSEVDLLNFKKAPAAAKSINTWVENKTNNKIKDLINPDDITDDTALVLVNAIYFKGKWLEPFNVSDTATEKFYLNENDSVDVQMMHIKKKFYYKDDEELGAQVLELPYTNKNISMIIILPRERNGIAQLEEKLANTDLTKITENMFKPEVEVSLPRFKIEQTIDLQDPLTQLGLGVIFSKDAELSGIIKTTQPLYVSKAIQKAFIEVNEEGAEAAAATGLIMGLRAAYLPLPAEEVRVDHPFAIQLIHREGPLIHVLFSGRVAHPKA